MLLIYNDIVHCEWGEWIIGECSEECGEGTRNNTRTLKVPSDYGGKECDGPTSFVETCKLQDCSGIISLGHLVRFFFYKIKLYNGNHCYPYFNFNSYL